MIGTNSDERRIKLTIEYDGTDFCGWQVQPDVRTIQGDIEHAFQTMFRAKPTVFGAGRTDTGVHALGQVAHVSIPNRELTCEQILNGINSLLSDDVKLLKVEDAPADFHARFNTTGRRYMYRILRNRHPLQRRLAWYPGCSWQDDIIQDATKVLIGRHSFKSFCRARPEENHYICNVIQADWEPDSNGATFNIIADRFFHQMVRGIVSALIDVGRGYTSPDKFRDLLENPVDNAQVQFAPSRGLTLVEIKYDK